MLTENRSLKDPFFSICIPQHNRTSYLLYALDKLAAQTSRDFEVCISDDCSTDGKIPEVQRHLEHLGLSYALLRRTVNGRYDANLRSALSLARGKYSLLMGNDDCLADETTIETLHDELDKYEDIGVVITNFADFETRAVTKRVFGTGIVPGGAPTAVRVFRNFSFVSGVIFRTALAQKWSTDSYDGSEMYQLYLGSRIIAAGYPLLQLSGIAVLKDIRIDGRPASSPPKRQVVPRLRTLVIPILARFGKTAYGGIEPYAPNKSALAIRMFRQLYAFTYPYWILEFRKDQSWRYAVCACLGMRPRITLAEVDLSIFGRIYLYAVYIVSMGVSLTMPKSWFESLKSQLHRFAKLSTKV